MFERKIIKEEESFCIKHNKSFTATTHQLPSSKLYITSCADCEIDKLNIRRYDYMKKYLYKNNHTIDSNLKWSWEVKKDIIVEDSKPIIKNYWSK